MEYFKMYIEQFFSMGIYAYFIIAFIVVAFVLSILSMKFQKNAKAKWLSSHPGAVMISLETGNNFITQKELYANVISGEAAMFIEKGRYTIWSMPGDIVIEVRYTYTRPGVLYKNVSTTWGPTKISLHIEKDKQYALSFDKKEEKFILKEK